MPLLIPAAVGFVAGVMVGRVSCRLVSPGGGALPSVALVGLAGYGGYRLLRSVV